MSAPTLLRSLALGALLALAPFARAAVVDGLYEGQVAVSGEDEGERAAALGRALRQVVSKLTGLAQPGGAVVDEALARPQQFLQQFRYRESGDPGAPLALWARFDPAAVDAMLREAGLAAWGAQRPGVLLWLVVARAEGPEIVASDAAGEVAPALRRRAWERGVPVSFPLLDLEERVRVRPADLLALDTERIAQASQRYAPGAVLVGRAEPDGAGAWVARWWLDEGGRVSEWETRGLSAAAAAAGAMDAVADRLASRYAVAAGAAGGEDGGIEVRVGGVRGLADYARALSYLQRLDQVSQVALTRARGDEFVFRMQVRGGEEGLRRLASFGDVLQAQPSEGGVLRFRLLP